MFQPCYLSVLINKAHFHLPFLGISVFRLSNTCEEKVHTESSVFAVEEPWNLPTILLEGQKATESLWNLVSDAWLKLVQAKVMFFPSRSILHRKLG